MIAAFAKPDSARAAAATGGVQSIDRAIGLLEALAEHDGIRLTDLARQVGLSLSTVHRLMTALQKHGFVQCAHMSNKWHIGRQALLVGGAFYRQNNFVPGIAPFLRNLRDQTRETTNLGMLNDGKLMFLTRFDSKEIVRSISNVGGYAPLTVSGMGKALLACYAPDDIVTIVKGERFITPTPKSLRSAQTLHANLEVTRERGYAVDDEEYQLGVRCVASVIYGAHGEPRCAISVSGSIERLTDERVKRLGALVRTSAEEITISTGGQMPA